MRSKLNQIKEPLTEQQWQLVENHLYLVRSHGTRWARRMNHKPLCDIHEEVKNAIIVAAQSFQDSYGEFKNYAVRIIKNHMICVMYEYFRAYLLEQATKEIYGLVEEVIGNDGYSPRKNGETPQVGRLTDTEDKTSLSTEKEPAGKKEKYDPELLTRRFKKRMDPPSEVATPEDLVSDAEINAIVRRVCSGQEQELVWENLVGDLSQEKLAKKWGEKRPFVRKMSESVRDRLREAFTGSIKI